MSAFRFAKSAYQLRRTSALICTLFNAAIELEELELGDYSGDDAGGRDIGGNSLLPHPKLHQLSIACHNATSVLSFLRSCEGSLRRLAVAACDWEEVHLDVVSELPVLEGFSLLPEVDQQLAIAVLQDSPKLHHLTLCDHHSFATIASRYPHLLVRIRSLTMKIEDAAYQLSPAASASEDLEIHRFSAIEGFALYCSTICPPVVGRLPPSVRHVDVFPSDHQCDDVHIESILEFIDGCREGGGDPLVRIHDANLRYHYMLKDVIEYYSLSRQVFSTLEAIKALKYYS